MRSIKLQVPLPRLGYLYSVLRLISRGWERIKIIIIWITTHAKVIFAYRIFWLQRRWFPRSPRVDTVYLSLIQQIGPILPCSFLSAWGVNTPICVNYHCNLCQMENPDSRKIVFSVLQCMQYLPCYVTSAYHTLGGYTNTRYHPLPTQLRRALVCRRGGMIR